MPKQLFSEIDALVRTGDLKIASEKLRAARYSQFAPEQLGKVCLLARRCGLPELGVRLLAPLVRPVGKMKGIATPEHIVEYAGALIHLGSVAEGLQLLMALKEPFLAQVHLYRAFAYFSRWEYATAIPELERYIARSELTEYEQAVGRANLAAALTYERNPRAHDFLLECIDDFEGKGYKRLHLNLLMSLCDLELAQGRVEEAATAIFRAKTMLQGDHSLDALFIEKWAALLKLYQANSDAPEAIHCVREKAREKRHWETLRNLDYHCAVIHKETALLGRLYFGTPYPALRERMVRDFGLSWTAPESFDWKPNPSVASSILDLSKVEGKWKIGQLTHKLICVLASDFYRPVSLGSLFAQVFPDEHYHPVHSPVRMHQMIKRARKQLENSGLVLTEEEGAYSLFGSTATLRIPREFETTSRVEHHLARIEKAFPGAQGFSAREAAEVLDLNYWSVVKWLKEAVEQGSIEKSGAARSTRYRICRTSAYKQAG